MPRERERERSEGKSPLIWVEWDVHIVEASGKDNALKLWLNVILMLKEENDFRIRCHILEKKKRQEYSFCINFIISHKYFELSNVGGWFPNPSNVVNSSKWHLYTAPSILSILPQ